MSSTIFQKSALEKPHCGAIVSPRNASRHGRDTLMSVQGLAKSYQRNACRVPVLCGVDLQVHSGEFLAIVGQSGSGKSTLLHLLAALDSPDEGSIHWNGMALEQLPSHARDTIRNRDFGIIFQFYHLLPELTAWENVLLSKWIALGPWRYWCDRRELRERAKQLLDRVGLGHRTRHRPRELSGGEMQRVAVARALMSQPRVLFADEPTGNLDRQTGSAIMELLRGLHQDDGLTIVLVTHDPTIASQANRRIQLVEGKVVED